MEVKAKLKTYRQSARKVRLLAKEISGKPLDEAKADLSVASKRVAPVILKLIKSAEANAKDRKVDSDRFFIKRIWIDEGPTLFRMMPRAHGRAFVIRKRTSHINIVLAPEENTGEVVKESNSKIKKKSTSKESAKGKKSSKEKITNNKVASA